MVHAGEHSANGMKLEMVVKVTKPKLSCRLVQFTPKGCTVVIQSVACSDSSWVVSRHLALLTRLQNKMLN